MIDQQSGAKLVLELRKTARSGPVRDLAATPTLLAVVAADSSITVFRVPEHWDRDDLVCQEIAYFSPPSSSRVLQVEWVTKASASALAIGTPSGVSLVDQSTMASRRHMSLDLLIESPQMRANEVCPCIRGRGLIYGD